MQQTEAAKSHDSGQGVEAPSRPAEAALNPHAHDEDGIAPEGEKEGHWYADADWWVAVFTAALFAATTGLWIFTWLLWRATKDTIDHARDSSEKELRAYVAVAPMGVAQLIGQSDTIGQVEVRNIGKLPARNVSVSVHMEMGARERNLFSFNKDGVEDRVLQPGEAMRQGSADYIPLTTIAEAKHHVFVWGYVWYEDGFGKRRFTRFCHRYSCASYNRDETWNRKATSTRFILEADKARLHNHGNDAT